MPQGDPEGYAAPFQGKKLSEKLAAKGKKMAAKPSDKKKFNKMAALKREKPMLTEYGKD